MTVTTTPNLILVESSRDRIARQARQRVGSTDGIQMKTRGVQEFEDQKKRPKDHFVLKPINKDNIS